MRECSKGLFMPDFMQKGLMAGFRVWAGAEGMHDLDIWPVLCSGLPLQHFISIATPHLGCHMEGLAQVSRSGHLFPFDQSGNG